MSESRLISTTGNNDEGWVIVDWTQVSDDAIRYNTDDKEEMMRVWLEGKRAAREKAEAERAEWEAKEKREAEQRHKAKADDGDEARGEVKKVVMDPGCTRCARMATRRGWPACTATSQKAGRVDKGKKRKADEEMPEPGPSKKKLKAVDKPLEVLDIDEDEAGRSRPRGPSATVFSGLEDKLKCLINIMGLITNNLDCCGERDLPTLRVFGMAMFPSDLGSSELDSDELCEEADWLKAHGEDKEEESSREDETMAEAK
ncbi:hypothetical protein BKA82DRAFT_4358630 [Pisolithus tinctorius]|nr:hypothetical protein BKA82DRAFT_4358630 [Pisolithus tinctorius]